MKIPHSIRPGFAALLTAGSFFLIVGFLVHGLTQHPALAEMTVENPFGYRILCAIPDSDDHYTDSEKLSIEALRRDWPAFRRQFDRTPSSPARFYWVTHAYISSRPHFTLILSVWFYLALLTFFYHIGKHLWGSTRLAFSGAALIALWPSALLHFVQPIKDPVFVAGEFAFLLGAILLVRCQSRWRTVFLGLFLAFTGFHATHWVRPHVTMLNAAPWALLLLFLCYGLVKNFRHSERAESLIVGTKLVLAVLFLFGMFQMRVAIPSDGREAYLAPEFTPTRIAKNLIGNIDKLPTPETETPVLSRSAASTSHSETIRASQKRLEQQKPLRGRELMERMALPSTIQGHIERSLKAISRRLTVYRYEWAHGYPHASSNIHTDVDFEDNPGKIIRFLPTALKVGFLSPFPSMWFEEGRRTGRAGRLLAGVEMAVFYLFLPFALVAAVYHRRRAETWILLAFTFAHVTLLGYVVTNVGALMRMRFPSTFIVILFAVEGIRLAWHRLKPSRGFSGPESSDAKQDSNCPATAMAPR